ncbi:MAG: RNA methyltransferase [Cyclobacteriaceae bacterium]
MDHFTITSLQNPKVKSLLALEKPRERRKQQLFLIEGLREIGMAAAAGYEFGNLFFCPELITPDRLRPLGDERLMIPVSREVFEKIAIRENSGGVVAVAKQKVHRLEDLVPGPNPLILVLEAVEKPGNLGAILRTADAAGVDAVIICDPQTDFYNPNVVRSSIGCLFTVPLAAASSADTIAWLEQHGIAIYCTYLKASKPYDEVNYSQPSAFIMGTEATGLSDEWVQRSSQNIIIPMRGRIDSMNVSNAAAIVIFEALRQRKKAS